MRSSGLIFLLLLFLGFSGSTFGQIYSDYNKESEAEEYPYLLPIWGKKVAEKGFDLPYF